MDNKDKFFEDIKSVVAQIFSEKEESDKVKQTEEALQRLAVSNEELTVTLEASNEEVADLQEKLTVSDEKTIELQAGLEAAQKEVGVAKKEVEEANQKISETEAALEEINKDRAAEIRMSEIEEAGIARKDSDSQLAKVREMSDEEFTEYKEELVSVREAIKAELEAAKAKVKGEGVVATENTTQDTAGASDVNTEEENIITPPVNVSPGDAVSAAMNLEIITSKDISAKYADLGNAMAAALTKSK